MVGSGRNNNSREALCWTQAARARSRGKKSVLTATGRDRASGIGDHAGLQRGAPRPLIRTDVRCHWRRTSARPSRTSSPSSAASTSCADRPAYSGAISGCAMLDRAVKCARVRPSFQWMRHGQMPFGQHAGLIAVQAQMHHMRDVLHALRQSSNRRARCMPDCCRGRAMYRRHRRASHSQARPNAPGHRSMVVRSAGSAYSMVIPTLPSDIVQDVPQCVQPGAACACADHHERSATVCVQVIRERIEPLRMLRVRSRRRLSNARPSRLCQTHGRKLRCARLSKSQAVIGHAAGHRRRGLNHIEAAAAAGIAIRRIARAA